LLNGGLGSRAITSSNSRPLVNVGQLIGASSAVLPLPALALGRGRPVVNTVVQSDNLRPYRRAVLYRLRLLQFRLWLERFFADALRGLCLGLALALGGAIALVVRTGVVDRASLALLALVGLTGGAFWALARPPSLLRTARTADARFQLQARLGTAVEQLSHPTEGRLSAAQLTDTARALTGARGGWPLPPLIAWREALLAVAMIAVLVATLRFEGHGAGLLDGLPPILRELPQAGERQTLDESQASTKAPSAGNQASGQTSTALRTLDELRRAREAGTLTNEQAASALNQVESELNRQSAEARGQRETLDRLARALSQVSASEEAAQSIQQGDYERAGQQLAQLGQESDQLSPDARRELSQALRSAAAQSGDSPDLAERERRAAEALGGRDYQATQSALAGLGDEVARNAGRAASQGELGDAMQRLQQERSANPSSGAGADRVEGSGGQRSATGQSGGSQAGDGEGSGRGNGSSPAEAGRAGQDSRPPPPTDGPTEKTNPTELGATAERLDVAGTPVEVPVQAGAEGEGGAPTQEPRGDEQVVDGSQASFESDQAATLVQASGQAERIVVPGDQRQVVREYFGRRGGRGTP
jgi:hypothetical protein